MENCEGKETVLKFMNSQNNKNHFSGDVFTRFNNNREINFRFILFAFRCFGAQHTKV